MSTDLPPGTRSADLVVNGSAMHYLEVGSGPPVVFLHGNPTSSLLWRHVIGPVARSGRRALALDLIGMGRSDKPDIGYRLVDHIAYVDEFIQIMDLDRPVLVGHDWGGVIALHLAARHREQVRGVVFLECHLHPIEHWSDLDAGGREMFGRIRTPVVGEQMVIDENFFVEVVLPAGTLRTLGEDEMNGYRAPYLQKTARRPLLIWPREIPIEGSPADVVELVVSNQEVIENNNMPTLLLHGDPGAVIGAAEVAWCRDHGRSLTVVDVGPGLHFLPEDRPDQIASAITSWLDRLD